MELVKFVAKTNGKNYVAFKMTEQEYRALDEEYSGLCIRCGAETCGGTEPDARQYSCESCEEKAVYGIQELLVMGSILLVDGE